MSNFQGSVVNRTDANANLSWISPAITYLSQLKKSQNSALS